MSYENEEKDSTLEQNTEHQPNSESPAENTAATDVENTNPQEATETSDTSVTEASTSENPPETAAEPAESSNSEWQNENDSEDDEDEEQEEEEKDYSGYNKAQLLEELGRLGREGNPRQIAQPLRDLKTVLDEKIEEEEKAALEKFIAEGGDKEDFEYQHDDTTKNFNKLYREVWQKRRQFLNDAEAEKQKNLERKNQLLDKLRNLIDNDETEDSFKSFQALREEWKSIGEVPRAQNKNLWANYNALVELYYDQRSIYFELKDLDRKKNFAQKLTLCEKAEALLNYESIKESIQELNQLHEEYKHIGPVPREEQEALWQRFKAASDKVYERKRAHIQEREKQKEANLEQKLALCEKVAPFAEFKSEKIKEWNAKTKEILAIQKEWNAVGIIPRNKIKEVSKTFWSSFKTFFNNKNAFIKTLDEAREGNLKAKQALCEEAKQIIENGEEEDKRKTADALKDLQRKWKTIGPVPSKYRNSIFEEFKSICDAFFNARREEFAAQEKVYEDNLEQKQALCQRISEYKLAEGEDPKEKIQTFVEEWKAIGFVPRKSKDKIEQQFDKAIDAFINNLNDLSEGQQEDVKFAAELALFQESPDALRRLQSREGRIRKQIRQIENDIDTLKNNLGFLANSKKANTFRDSVEKQIEGHEGKLKALKRQLRLIRNA